MKIINTNFLDIGEDYFLRFDEKFFLFYKKNQWNIFNTNTNKNKTIKLKDIIKEQYENFIFEDNEEYYGIPTGQTYINDFGEIIDKVIISKDIHPDRLKYKINENSILISSLRLAKSPVLNFKNIDYNKYVFSNGFYIFCIKDNKKFNEKFIIYLLNSEKIKNIINNNIYRGIGISSYKVSDLLNIKIPLIPLSIQNEIMEKIKPIESKIEDLKKQIIDDEIIINEIFSKEFEFNIKEFEEIKNKENFYKLDLKNINDFSLRFSYIQNSNISLYIKKFLNKLNYIYLKNILKEKKIYRGIQPQYIENGNIPIIKTLNIQKNKVIFDENILYTNISNIGNINKCKIEKNDLLLTSTGMGRGKFAIYKNEDFSIADSHISIIKIKDNIINIDYLFYYCCSLFGFYQLKYIETQVKGTPEIQEPYLKYFKIPNIPLSKQQEIVNKINQKLEEQNKIKITIEGEKKKINDLIEGIII